MDLDAPRILIVEDHLDTCHALRVRLRASGYQTVSSANGLAAPSIASRDLPDLIILDIGLPGADGFQVLEHLQQNTRLAGIPVLVLTARDPRNCERRAFHAGASAFLQKPADNRLLLDTISDLLEGNGTVSTPPRWEPESVRFVPATRRPPAHDSTSRSVNRANVSSLTPAERA